MPFYEYECSNCKFYVEVLQKISDAPLKKCPSCGKSALKKLVSAPVFRLKGAGWYETDFKSEQEGKRNLAGADEAPPPAEDGKKDNSESKADSKAEKKADTKPDVKSAAGKPASRSRPVAKTKAKPKAKARPAKKKSKR